MNVVLLSTHAVAQQDTTIVLKDVEILATYEAPVSVTGEKIPIRQIPQSISLIKLKQIQELNLNTIDEALQHVIGVTTIANDNMRSQYKARGYNMSIMNDGLPSYNALSTSQQLDLSFYQQIEVLRGPAGLLQGAPDGQSLGGVINLIKKRPVDELGIHTVTSIGSWKNYRNEIDINIPMNKSKTLLSRWMFFSNDRDFFYERSHQTKVGAYGVIEWKATPNTLLNISYSFQNAKSDVLFNGIPAVRETSDDQSRNIFQTGRSTNPTPDWDNTKWTTHDVFFSAKQTINEDWLAVLKANYRTQAQQNKFGFPGTITASDTTSNYQRGWNDEDIPRLASSLDMTGKFRLFQQEHSVFLGLNVENFDDKKEYISSYYKVQWGHPELVPDFVIPFDNLSKSKTRITQAGLYGQVRLSILNPLKVILGGRIGSVYAKMYNYTDSKWVDVLEEKYKFTPFAGIVYTPIKQLTFYASYSDVFVPQTEKKEDGSILDPRTGSQFEIGTKNDFFKNRLSTNVAFFYLKDDGRAYRVSPAPAYINGGKVENKGIDIEINGNPLNGIELTAGYTYLKTKATKSTSGDEGLAFSPVEPKNSFKFWGVYRFERGTLKGLSAGIGLMAFSSKYASVITPERKQDSYSVVNAFVGYIINSHFSLNANFNNIFDTVYYARLGGNGDYFGDPCNFNLSLRCKF